MNKVVNLSQEERGAAEAYFDSMKRERVWRRKYLTRSEARADVFDYIEVFYNRKRRHECLAYLSPADFENKILAKVGGPPVCSYRRRICCGESLSALARG